MDVTDLKWKKSGTHVSLIFGNNLKGTGYKKFAAIVKYTGSW